VSNSLLHTNVVANEGTNIDESVILPDCVIGTHCNLRRVILDRHCKIPSGTIIGHERSMDEKYFHVTDDGVVLVTPKMLEAKANSDDPQLKVA